MKKATHQLEWLTSLNQPNKVVCEGDFTMCYDALVSLVHSAPVSPYVTSLVLYEVDGDGVKSDMVIFAFGRSIMKNLELVRVGEEPTETANAG